MLAVQYNSEADRAFEAELRQQGAELLDKNFYDALEAYLSQEDWRQADEETAWLFYVVMVSQGYKDCYELFKKFPNDTLNKIDRLWITSSKGQYGFSIQKRTWLKLSAGLQSATGDTWDRFCELIGWRVLGQWKEYDTLSFTSESPKGSLPFLPFWLVRSGGKNLRAGWGSVLSLLSHQDLI